ncbi:unnamed protein product [Clonostachys rosea f. rosea IK726]|uniref:Uncharacterized protein n=1 Tax=Clonostachys rosea f. rosea IK726 TaxID=1349383 RepID=A0ACA9USV2_BIOOC|nr:unnamed protein product [Clonostachys rosea f. rosea IK726]
MRSFPSAFHFSSLSRSSALSLATNVTSRPLTPPSAVGTTAAVIRLNTLLIVILPPANTYGFPSPSSLASSTPLPVDAVAVTRQPSSLATCTLKMPTPPVAPLISTLSPLPSRTCGAMVWYAVNAPARETNRVCNNEGCERAGGLERVDAAEDGVAGAEGGDVGADGLDGAREVHAGGLGEAGDGAGDEAQLLDLEVGGVKAGGDGLDEDLARGQGGWGRSGGRGVELQGGLEGSGGVVLPGLHCCF